MHRQNLPEMRENEKIFNSEFICIFLANAMMYLGQYMVQPLVTTYAKELGATEAVLGIVASAFALTALLFKVFSGPSLDAFERKFIIFGAMLVLATAFLGYSFVKTIKMIIVLRLVQGIAQAFTATGYMAMAADALPQSKLSSGMAVFALAQTICTAISPTLGLAIREKFGFPTTFLFSAIFVYIASLLSLAIKPSDRPKKKFAIKPENFIAKEAIIPAILAFLVLIPQALINSYLVIYATDVVGIAGIGTFFTVNTVVMIFTRPLIGKLSDKYGFVRTFIPALFMFAIAYFIISYAKTLPVFLIAAVVTAFGNGVCQPLINSLAMKAVPQQSRGAASSTVYVGMDLGNLIGPPLAAAVITSMGYRSMWRVMTVFAFVAVIMTFLFRKNISGIEKTEREND